MPIWSKWASSRIWVLALGSPKEATTLPNVSIFTSGRKASSCRATSAAPSSRPAAPGARHSRNSISCNSCNVFISCCNLSFWAFGPAGLCLRAFFAEDRPSRRAPPGHVKSMTIRLKSLPLASKSLYKSKLALAGERDTMSPAPACCRARDTASSMEEAWRISGQPSR